MEPKPNPNRMIALKRETLESLLSFISCKHIHKDVDGLISKVRTEATEVEVNFVEPKPKTESQPETGPQGPDAKTGG